MFEWSVISLISPIPLTCSYFAFIEFIGLFAPDQPHRGGVLIPRK
jgi:hypothetical protein